MSFAEISEFEQQSNIFRLTKEYLAKWLESSYLENLETFQEEYGANLNAFLSNYKFKNEGICQLKNGPHFYLKNGPLSTATYASQMNKKVIDDHMIRRVIEGELS